MGNALNQTPNTNNTTVNEMFSRSQTNFQWEYENIYLDLSKKGLGISIRGGTDSPNHKTGSKDIYVSRILNAGAVFEDGRLRLGDILLQVNGTSLVDVTHKEAVSTIINAGTYIHFSVKRRKYIDSSDIYEQILECDEDEPLIIRRDENPLLDEDNDYDNYENNLKTYNDCIKVELIRNENGFGFSLEGGIEKPLPNGDTGIYINNIIPNSPAHKSGAIMIGDEIVAINETNLESVPYHWALNEIRNSPALSIFTIRKKIVWD